MTKFMKSVMKRVSDKRERVHKNCQKILGSKRVALRICVSKLPCSSKDTHF